MQNKLNTAHDYETYRPNTKNNLHKSYTTSMLTFPYHLKD